MVSSLYDHMAANGCGPASDLNLDSVGSGGWFRFRLSDSAKGDRKGSIIRCSNGNGFTYKREDDGTSHTYWLDGSSKLSPARVTDELKVRRDLLAEEQDKKKRNQVSAIYSDSFEPTYSNYFGSASKRHLFPSLLPALRQPRLGSRLDYGKGISVRSGDSVFPIYSAVTGELTALQLLTAKGKIFLGRLDFPIFMSQSHNAKIALIFTGVADMLAAIQINQDLLSEKAFFGFKNVL